MAITDRHCELDIPFTQYLLPDGRKKEVVISRPQGIYDKAMAIIAAGYCFEIEILNNGLIHMTVSDKKKEEDLTCEVVPNGPEVPVAVDRMIKRFYEEYDIGRCKQ
jgi:hypothetical protein